MIHAVTAGDDDRYAGWSDVTHEMHGDRDICDAVMNTVASTGDLHDQGVQHDMSDPKFVVPAMVSAAHKLYGDPVAYSREPEPKVSISRPRS